MAVDDPLLPAAAHLVGPRARPILDAALGAFGGRLGLMRPRQVLYRPGRELVVRYDTTVEWGRAGPVDETLLAAVGSDGPPPGTLRVEAADPVDGVPLAVGVWRYPFDPSLPGLDAAVRSSHVGALVAARGPVELAVRTYRPTRRAVVHARWDGREAYVKVVRPEEARDLADVHARLSTAGIPVAPVLGADLASGLIVLGALGPAVLRSRVLGGHGPWPSAPAVRGLLERLSAVDVAMQAHRRLEPLAAALGHARLLATVFPAQAARLDEICGRLGPPAGSAGRATVHGDLHDGQIVVDEDRVTGLLDVDSVGPGHPIDDVANLVGHLTSLPVSAAAAARPIHAYARHLRDAWASDVDPIELDRRVAAVLLGLATGPFRVQERGWRRAVVHRLHLVEGWLPARERTLSGAS